MYNTTKYVGSDVSKEKLLSLMKGEENQDIWGRYPVAIVKLVKKLKKDGHTLHMCYEAGPTGYWLISLIA